MDSENKKNDTPEVAEDNTAGCAVVLILVIIMVGAIAYLSAEVWPDLRTWMNERAAARDATPTPEIILPVENAETEMTSEERQAFCDENCWCEEVQQVNAEACLPHCPTAWRVDERDMTSGEYLRFFDDMTGEIRETSGKIETLYEIFLERGPSVVEKLTVLEDETWIAVYDDVISDIDYIYAKSAATWLPGPYDGSNPLMDSHGRLLLAVVHLQHIQSDLVRFRDGRETRAMVGLYDDLGKVRLELERAQTGASLVKRGP